jgi:flagellar assembly protein FliH
LANLAAISAFSPEPDPIAGSVAPGEAIRAWDTLPALKGRAAAARTIVSSDDRDVAEIVLRARRAAETVRAEALRKANALLVTARADAEQVRQDAFVDGYAAGLNSARAEIAEELALKFDARCEALRSSVESIIDTIVVEREAMWNAMESEITSVALEIARKVIKTEVEQNAAVIEAVVKDSIRRVTDRGSVRLIVSPDDLKQIRTSREDLLQVIDGIKNLVIDADRRIGRGGCMIETTAGSIDSKVETQLEQVERAMRS